MKPALLGIAPSEELGSNFGSDEMDDLNNISVLKDKVTLGRDGTFINFIC
jgi:hypothetical protein